MDSQDRALYRMLSRGQRWFVLTGAGCSTASGLGDYRDRHGQWKRQQPMTAQNFLRSEDARRRYWVRSFVGWPKFAAAEPSTAHSALVHLQKLERIHHLVTQNVDGLHQKAGHTNVIDLHGVIDHVCCIECAWRIHRDHYQQLLFDMNSWLDELDAAMAPDGDADIEKVDFSRAQIPACTRCGGIMKPDVVFFGENVPRVRVHTAMNQLCSCDVIMVVGSSLMVFSGYRFVREANKCGKPIVIINDGITRADAIATLKISGECGARLNTLIRALQSTI